MTQGKVAGYNNASADEVESLYETLVALFCYLYGRDRRKSVLVKLEAVYAEIRTDVLALFYLLILLVLVMVTLLALAPLLIPPLCAKMASKIKCALCDKRRFPRFAKTSAGLPPPEYFTATRARNWPQN